MSTFSRRKCRPRLKFVSKAVEPSFMEAREGVNKCLFGSLLNVLDFFLESTIGRNIRLSRVLQWFRTCPIVQMSFQFKDRIFCFGNFCLHWLMVNIFSFNPSIFWLLLVSRVVLVGVTSWWFTTTFFKTVSARNSEKSATCKQLLGKPKKPYDQSPVVWKPISANQGLNFNLSFFLFSLKTSIYPHNFHYSL